MIMRFKNWLRKAWARVEPRRKLIVVNDDTPPARLATRNIYLAREDDLDWAVAMRCPCGCGDRLELMLIPEAKPNWRLKVNVQSIPSLHPSVWRSTNCKSHFWVKSGRIIWCD